MDDAARAELAELRARAYGPHADIGSDPAALTRLRELEDSARASATPVSVPAAAAAVPVPVRDPFAPTPSLSPPVAPPRPTAGEDERPDAGSAADAGSAEPAPHRSRAALVRRLWPVSIVAAVVVTAVATAGILGAFSGRGLSASQREVGTLVLEDRPGQVLFDDTTGDARSALFDGLTVVRSSGVLGSNGGECLVVYQTPQNGSDTSPLGGPIFFGCAAGALPALVQVGVDGDSPPALRKAFPTGTGLQFRLDGDEVRVIADDSGADRAAS